MRQTQTPQSTTATVPGEARPEGIVIDGISHSYGVGEAAVHTCDKISFPIRRGDLTTFLGPSGCGKTTLLKIIAGLITPSDGRVLIDGHEITGPGPDRALVFQNFALLPWENALSNAAFGLELRGVPKAERLKAAREALAVVRLTGFERAYPHELSGGMQQRVGLARALATNPQILLMDEPFASVDELTRRTFQEDLEKLLLAEKKTTVLFVTHSIDEAVYLSDRIIVFTSRPAKVGEIIDVPFPHPRAPMRLSPEFLQIVDRLWGLLKEDKVR